MKSKKKKQFYSKSENILSKTTEKETKIKKQKSTKTFNKKTNKQTNKTIKMSHKSNREAEEVTKCKQATKNQKE